MFHACHCRCIGTALQVSIWFGSKAKSKVWRGTPNLLAFVVWKLPTHSQSITMKWTGLTTCSNDTFLSITGLIPAEDWCQCGGACRVPQQPTRKMCVCCNEQAVLNDKRGRLRCIRHHPDFNAVALTPAVLHIVVNTMDEVRGYATNVNNWTNRFVEILFTIT